MLILHWTILPAQGRTFNHMMEERGFVRKQARVYGVSGKAWVGIRLKEHDELMKELPEGDAENAVSPEKGDHARPQVKQFPARQKFMTVFNGSVKLGLTFPWCPGTCQHRLTLQPGQA